VKAGNLIKVTKESKDGSRTEKGSNLQYMIHGEFVVSFGSDEQGKESHLKTEFSNSAVAMYHATADVQMPKYPLACHEMQLKSVQYTWSRQLGYLLNISLKA